MKSWFLKHLAFFMTWSIPTLSAIVAIHPILNSKLDTLRAHYPMLHFLWGNLDVIAGVCILFILIISFIDGIFFKPNVRKLQKENLVLSHENIFLSNQIRNTLQGYICKIARTKLPNFSEKERINIYLFHNETKFFTLEARFCSDPEHDKVKKKEYPLDKGCIYQGWKQGYFFDNKFPKNENDYYKYVSKHYQITRKELDKISKHSRMYCVMRIDDNKQKRLGVLVIESENSNYLNSQTLKSICNQEKDFLYHLLNTFTETISRETNFMAEEL